jgi:hypothetical protein
MGGQNDQANKGIKIYSNGAVLCPILSGIQGKFVFLVGQRGQEIHLD